MLISDFYKNKELFVTGGTGYLGKSLIEKVLRDCPDISKIYLLIRAKRNKTPLERMKEFSNDLIFERLHRERPNAFAKIIPIIGDTCELGLGISAEDLKRLSNVNIVVHGAANVRFDNVLRSSILMNTRGTYELLKLAVNFKNLMAFIHVSTAYVKPMESYLKEELVEAPVNWRTAIKIAETFPDEELEVLRIKYTEFPNAYSFSKNLSEQVVADFADKLPITILRPSIVAVSAKDPEPGFVDNLNGPVGGLVAVATGISQVTYCNGNLVMALIPVDTVTNLTIIAAYRRGLETLNSKKCGLDICNLTPGDLSRITLHQFCVEFLKHVKEEPFEATFWSPTNFMTTRYYLFVMAVFLINIPLAFIYDALLTLNKKEKMVMKVTRTYVNTFKTFGKFSREYYDFGNDAMWNLVKLIPEEETEKFIDDFLMKRQDLPTLCKNALYGVKKYVFKQPVKANPSIQRRYKILIVVDYFVKALLVLLIVKVLWKMFN